MLNDSVVVEDSCLKDLLSICKQFYIYYKVLINGIILFLAMEITFEVAAMIEMLIELHPNQH